MEASPAPITDDDETIATAVRAAYIPPLLAALAHATGDLTLLQKDLQPDPNRVHEPQGGLSAHQRAAARQLAVDTLCGLRDEIPDLRPSLAPDQLRQIMNYLVGTSVSADYLPLLLEELALSDDDLRAPGWTAEELDPGRHFVVAVVGAGMSGLLAAFRLQQAGVPYVVIEKNDDVGGTWWENRYPGCRVDVPNHLYSYSFAQRHDWTHRFTPQGELADYFGRCADAFGVREHIRFQTEVLAADYDDVRRVWTLTLREGGGEEETLTANAVVSAVGQLNRPSWPAINGRDDFLGTTLHSSAWDPDVALAGKRVAVIGTGATAIQLIPAIAPKCGELFVYQRTPNWFMPTADYHDEVPAGMQWLLDHVPYYSQWYRFWLFWRLAEGALPAARVDPTWPPDPGSVSPRNHELRTMLTQYLEAQFADRPDLLDQVVPHYPPLAKRILLDDGTWATTLKRDNVHLVTDGILRITSDGIVGADGTHQEVDVIVYATGFEASRFLMPMRIRGRNGADLHKTWDGDARAYLGITVPGFPNLFCLYGPNTNLVANGSIIFLSECEVAYVLGCIRLLFETHKRALDCRAEVCDAYNVRIDEGNARMVWGASSVNSWYKNRHRPRDAELAFHAAGVLAEDAPARSGRLRAALALGGRYSTGHGGRRAGPKPAIRSAAALASASSATSSSPATRPARRTTRPSMITVSTLPPWAEYTRLETGSTTGHVCGRARSTSTMSARLPGSSEPRSASWSTARAPSIVAISSASLRAQRAGPSARRVLEQASRLHLADQVEGVVVGGTVGSEGDRDAGVAQVAYGRHPRRHLHVG